MSRTAVMTLSGSGSSIAIVLILWPSASTSLRSAVQPPIV